MGYLHCVLCQSSGWYVGLNVMPIRLIRIMIPVVIVSIGIIYYYNNPTYSLWALKCPWWLLTGTYCPSCGIQRFLHQLLCGNIIDAFLLNPFLLLSIPYAILAVLGKWYNINGVFDKTNRIIYKRQTLILYIVLYFVWWAIRIIFKV